MPLDIALMRKWRGDGPELAVVGLVGVIEVNLLILRFLNFWH